MFRRSGSCFERGPFVALSPLIIIAVCGFSLMPVPAFGPLGTTPAQAQPIEGEDEKEPRSPFSIKRNLRQPRGGAVIQPPTPGHRGSFNIRRNGGRVIVPDRKPGVAYATNSIKCGDTVYEVSTGSGEGDCSKGEQHGEDVHTVCQDNDGNYAEATCARGCGPSSGSGSCKIKQAKQ